MKTRGSCVWITDINTPCKEETRPQAIVQVLVLEKMSKPAPKSHHSEDKLKRNPLTDSDITKFKEALEIVKLIIEQFDTKKPNDKVSNGLISR